MTEWKRGYQHEEKKVNILFLGQGIEKVFIDDLTKALTSTGNVFK